MVSITTQKEARNVRNLHFCYICGRPFNLEDVTNHDHVPPEAIFANQDRNFPLKLKTHQEPCHSSLNLDDEVIGQLLSLIHGKQPSARDDKLKLDIYKNVGTNNLLVSFNQRNIEPLVWRWVKGFHTALYQSPLLDNSLHNIQTPFPSGAFKSGVFTPDPILEQHFKFVEVIKRNRSAKNLDCIESNNGKLRYECVWDQLNDSSWICIFGLDLYGWKELGDVKHFQPRGCVGVYRLDTGLAPSNASLATKLDVHINNIDLADPFSP